MAGAKLGASVGKTLCLEEGFKDIGFAVELKVGNLVDVKDGEKVKLYIDGLYVGKRVGFIDGEQLTALTKANSSHKVAIFAINIKNDRLMMFIRR